jgi:hypothetical protein
MNWIKTTSMMYLLSVRKFGIEIPDEYGQSPPGAGQGSVKV